MPQPAKMSWKDTFASLVVRDTISYTLPENISNSAAPSELVIDGFGTLKMERSRISLDGGKTLKIIDADDTKKKPLHLKRSIGLQAPLAQGVAAGPAIGIGAGDAKRDTLLFNSKQLCVFGSFMFAAILGAFSVVASPVWGTIILVSGLIGMAAIYNQAVYHIPPQDPAQFPYVLPEGA